MYTSFTKITFFSFKIASQRMEVCHRMDRMSYVMQRAVANGIGTSQQISMSKNQSAAVAAATPLLAATNPAAAAVAVVAQQQQSVQSAFQLQPPDFSNLIHQYNAMAATSQIAAAATTTASVAAPYVYQPLAAVLPYGKLFFFF